MTKSGNDHLVYVEGICGELYYRLDDIFYRIKISDNGTARPNVSMHRYHRDANLNSYKIDKCQLANNEVIQSVFYTLASNYSHFAYNTEEYMKENAPDAVGGHWLEKVFHKNDAYQTPINLHPYRNKGNIDINRERLLSTQRLLISIASSIRKNEYSGIETAVDINDKIPYELIVRDIGFSKLQENTIKKYFKDNLDSNIVGHHIDFLKESLVKFEDGDNGDKLICDLAESSMSHLSRNYLRKPVMRFYESAIKWLYQHDLVTPNSDLSQLIDKIEKLNRDAGIYMMEREIFVWKELKCLSAIQFLRLALVYDICKMWNTIGVSGEKNSILLSVDPIIIFKRYDSLSNAEKCYHYIIYKTIEIFCTYPSYQEPLRHYASPELFFSYSKSDTPQTTLYDLKSAFDRLSADWHKGSHITLKMRQAYNLLRGKNFSKKLYADVTKDKEKSIIFESLSEKYIGTLSNIETLPPPIFIWEIIYRRKNQREPIPFSSFSSGEKQKLFFQSAIIYHLRNINSIGDARFHYHSVNLVFEEIELYFHPEWQRTLIYDLMQSIRGANIPKITSVNMIFVTHSPYVLSDIPKSNVLFLKDGMPVYEMQENTFGANINSLLKNGFFLPSLPMGEFAYRKINILFEKLHSGDFDPRTLKQLYAQIMTVGEPAIRSQLMNLLAPYMRLFLTK